jgi:hypothetical protein
LGVKELLTFRRKEIIPITTMTPPPWCMFDNGSETGRKDEDEASTLRDLVTSTLVRDLNYLVGISVSGVQTRPLTPLTPFPIPLSIYIIKPPHCKILIYFFYLFTLIAS